MIALLKPRSVTNTIETSGNNLVWNSFLRQCCLTPCSSTPRTLLMSGTTSKEMYLAFQNILCGKCLSTMTQCWAHETTQNSWNRISCMKRQTATLWNTFSELVILFNDSLEVLKKFWLMSMILQDFYLIVLINLWLVCNHFKWVSKTFKAEKNITIAV